MESVGRFDGVLGFFVEGKKRRRELDIKEKNTQGGREWDDMMKRRKKKGGGGGGKIHVIDW